MEWITRYYWLGNADRVYCKAIEGIMKEMLWDKSCCR